MQDELIRTVEEPLNVFSKRLDLNGPRPICLIGHRRLKHLQPGQNGSLDDGGASVGDETTREDSAQRFGTRHLLHGHRMRHFSATFGLG